MPRRIGKGRFAIYLSAAWVCDINAKSSHRDTHNPARATESLSRAGVGKRSNVSCVTAYSVKVGALPECSLSFFAQEIVYRTKELIDQRYKHLENGHLQKNPPRRSL